MPTATVFGVALGSGGRLVAAAPYNSPRADKVVRVWDLSTGGAHVLGPWARAGEGWTGGVTDLQFVGESHVLLAGDCGLQLFDLASGRGRDLTKETQVAAAVGPGGRFVLSASGGANGLVFQSLEGNESKSFPAHRFPISIAIDATGTVVATGSEDGAVRVGPISDGEPQLLLGHEGRVRAVALSPDGHPITAFKEFDYRTHVIAGQDGWEEVAEYLLTGRRKQQITGNR